jgi:hypothetical protein
VQAERRLERSRNATTAAVPLTEANATAFSFSARDERALRRSGTRAGRGGRHLRYALHFHSVRKSHRHRVFFRQTHPMKASSSHRASLPGSNCRLTRMSIEINCRKWLKLPDGRRHSVGDEMKQKVVMNSSQPSFLVLAKLGLKNQRKTMQIKNDVSEQEALTISKSASALGVHEFSLFSRIQAGDIIAARLWSGEMAIPISELERLSKLSIYSLAIPPDKSEADFSDPQLGIKHGWGGLTRQSGEPTDYSVPGYSFRFTESEINGYRAAFGVIANEFQSLAELKKQLEKPATVVPSPEKEICTSQLGVWQVRSTLLNLGPSDILLCHKQNDFAVIERFRDDVPYAKANGIAEILLERNDPREAASAFNENAKHTLEFMASNQVATAQRVIWGQFQEHRPARLVEAISERCRLAVSDEETISQTQTVENSISNKRGHNRGMSI